MDHLGAAALEELRATLLAERTRLRARAEAPVADDAIGDMQDHAAEDARLERSVRLADHERRRLQDVEAALARMADGSYGICEETGEPIPLARLRSEPTTRYTVEALEQLERERARARQVERDDDETPY